jgi:hypothetical protein
MQTQDEELAVEQMMEYVPDEDIAVNMVRLARYGAERGHTIAVCAMSPDDGVVSVIYDRGWWKI